MLKDEQVNNKKLPILRRLDELNSFISCTVAEGIVNSHDDAQYKQDLKKINKRINDCLLADFDELYGLLFLVALGMYKDSKIFFEYNGKPFVKMADNKPVMAIINQVADNLIKSHSSKLSLDNMYVKPKDSDKVIVSAWYKNALGSNDPVDIHRNLNTLTESGIREGLDNGNTGRLDTVTENEIDNSIKELSQQVQDEVGKQFGADGKELSVHAFPAPDHAPVQGHVFYNEEYDKMQNGEDFEDVDGNSFIGFERAIGMWNCRHFAFSVVVGVHPRNYTQKQLNEILANNDKGYKYKGKHFTMYECTQLQRRYEREIRKAKDGYIVSKAGNDKELMNKYHSRVNKYMNEYKAFSKGCGLRIKYNRIYVEGYK